MRYSQLLLVALVFSILGVATDAGQGVVPPTAGPLRPPLDVVRSSVAGVLATAPSRPAVNGGGDGRVEIHRVANDLFDVQDMARRALGQHWQHLAPREQQEFVRLFTAVLNRSFVSIVEKYSGEELAFVGEEIARPYARVHTRIIPDRGVEISIEYRLVETASRWAVYDVVLDGMSLVSNYRSQFNSILRKSSVTQLVYRMKTEQARRTESRGIVERPPAPELEAPAPDRLAVGLLLSAALSARWR